MSKALASRFPDSGSFPQSVHLQVGTGEISAINHIGSETQYSHQHLHYQLSIINQPSVPRHCENTRTSTSTRRNWVIQDQKACGTNSDHTTPSTCPAVTQPTVSLVVAACVVCLIRDVVDDERDDPHLYHFGTLRSLWGSVGVGTPPKPYWDCRAPKAAA